MVIFLFFLIICLVGEFYFTYRDMYEKKTGLQNKRSSRTVAIVLGGSSCVLIMELVDLLFMTKVPSEIARTVLSMVFVVVTVVIINLLAKALAERKYKRENKN